MSKNITNSQRQNCTNSLKGGGGGGPKMPKIYDVVKEQPLRKLKSPFRKIFPL